MAAGSHSFAQKPGVETGILNLRRKLGGEGGFFMDGHATACTRTQREQLYVGRKFRKKETQQRRQILCYLS